MLRDVLRGGWNIAATSMTYQAVGFGSHHWLVGTEDGDSLFVTVDDLAAKVRTAADTADAAFARLERAFATALSLRRAGLEFVVAPVPAAGGRVVARLAARYSLVVHPYVKHSHAGRDGAFDASADRLAVLDQLITLHGSRAESPDADDFVVPRVAELTAALGQTGAPWRAGPYGPLARDLLATHAADMTRLLAAYDRLAARVARTRDRMVITHGEPHSANVLETPGGFVWVDWESVLLAPPERDLWALAETDASIPAAYASATGVAIDNDALALYRMWYDLAEIAAYISLFRDSHGETADTAEAWRNLRHFLRPASRWPSVFSRSDLGR
jgi:spectinomycin phosphotransferase